jgi:hypothetical protein
MKDLTLEHQAGPCLCRRAAHVGLNQANWNFFLFHDFSAELVSDRGEV